jgi:hypothetical protein
VAEGGRDFTHGAGLARLGAEFPCAASGPSPSSPAASSLACLGATAPRAGAKSCGAARLVLLPSTTWKNVRSK